MWDVKRRVKVRAVMGKINWMEKGWLGEEPGKGCLVLGWMGRKEVHEKG